MKRRTRRRIVRTLLTCAVIGAMVALACLHRWRHPDDARVAAAMARHDREIASCEASIRPRLGGEVEGWRLIDDQPLTGGRQFIFEANFNARATRYRCEVDASAAVVSVDGPA